MKVHTYVCKTLGDAGQYPCVPHRSLTKSASLVRADHLCTAGGTFTHKRGPGVHLYKRQGVTLHNE